MQKEDQQYDRQLAEEQDEISRTYFKNMKIMKHGQTEKERQNAAKIVKDNDSRDKKAIAHFKGFKSLR